MDPCIVLEIHGPMYCVVNKPQAPPAVPMHATPQGHLRTHTATMYEAGCFGSWVFGGVHANLGLLTGTATIEVGCFGSWCSRHIAW